MNKLLSKLKLPTPIVSVNTEEESVSIAMKRDELNHAHVQGNKWRKLKHNFQAYQEGAYEQIISFGGVFSNHVYALAAATTELDIPCTLFLRGYTLDEENPTVQFLRSCKVDIQLLDHPSYREKNSPVFLADLNEKYPNAYIIPEGGTNAAGVLGARELGHEIMEQCKGDLPDYICVSAGTGGTAAGIIKAFNDTRVEVLVFSSLKGDFLKADIARLSESDNFTLVTDYHFKGYARFNEDLISFINRFKTQNGISLEPIYTGKMMYGIHDLIVKNYFPTGSKILAIHTGGLQGIKGYNYRYASKYGAIK